MTNSEFHKPFLKSMVVVALVTLFAMVSSRYIVEYYANHSVFSNKTIEYSSQQPQNQSVSSHTD